MKDIFDIIKEAKKALSQIENGKVYSSQYISNRFIKSANENPHDLLINNMRDVVLKKASNQEFISQAELTEIYDQMIGFGGRNSAFRYELGDLLKENRQYAEPEKRVESNLRVESDSSVKLKNVNQELSNAFSVALGFGQDNAFGMHNPNQNNMVKKVVISSLSAEGETPDSVELLSENDHFVLTAAIYNDGHQKVALHVPVQISGGIVQPPSVLVHNNDTMSLNKENIWIALKELKKNKKYFNQQKFASQRDNSKSIKVEPQVIPSSLEKFANFETAIVSASTMHSSKSISKAMALLSEELKTIGAFNPQIKIAKAEDHEIIFSATVPTEKGNSILYIPIEIHNGNPNLPSKFASENNSSEQIYDFSSLGYNRFLSDVKGDSRSIKVARQTGNLFKASYHELMDIMLNGIATKDYKSAENALSVIQERFDSSQFKSAFDKFTQLLKHSSTDQDSERKRNIEAAVNRGDLIKHSTTVELFCPKLGLPLSKIAFDQNGNVIPMRSVRSSNSNEESLFISSYDIKFS